MVFRISLLVVVVFVIWGIVDPAGLAGTSEIILAIMTEKFGWFYLLATFSFLIFALYLAFSKYGSIKLGADNDRPEYTTKSWFAMLFSAGMGIGLVFWGVAEPMSHFLVPPQDAAPQSAQAARLAMRYSFFHWGLHAWGIYTVIGLSIAYFTFRRGHSGLISSTFYPLLGEKVKGLPGKAIDTLAIIATVFGVATSLGLGTLQINGGLAHVANIDNELNTQLTIIAVLTVLYLISATTGIDKGIKTVSNINLLTALALLVFVLFAGPTSFIFDVLTTTVGSYVQNLVQMSLTLTPFTAGSWIKNWTLFYWAWWIAWAPFVGMFIARVSKGRTIKEFVLGVLIAPSVFGFIWFSVFGGTGLNLELFHHGEIAEAVHKDVTSALFLTLDQLPLGTVLSVIATTLIITFFITSADSATFVLGMLSSNGISDPSTAIKMVWGLLQSSIAAVLLFSGGLQGLQTASVVAAAPFSIIMCLMCYSLLIALAEEFDQKVEDPEKPPHGSREGVSDS